MRNESFVPLLALQVAAEAAVGALLWIATGAASFVLPGVFGFAALTGGVYVAAKASPRPRVWARRLAARSGALHMVMGAAGYVAAWAQAPELYGFTAAALPVAAGAIALLVGGIAFALSICAADLGIHTAGGYADAGADAGSFRVPPSFRDPLPPLREIDGRD